MGEQRGHHITNGLDRWNRVALAAISVCSRDLRQGARRESETEAQNNVLGVASSFWDALVTCRVGAPSFLRGDCPFLLGGWSPQPPLASRVLPPPPNRMYESGTVLFHPRANISYRGRLAIALSAVLAKPCRFSRRSHSTARRSRSTARWSQRRDGT